MSRIKVLPDAIANRIAAGEVVERPYSVVKELVENALDAGCTSLEVDLKRGGTDRITVTDDGEGMDYDDALLAFERHATSKIETDADLNGVATMGFRGEALPSIASVSRLRLTTKPADLDMATSIYLEGGVIKDVKRTAGTKGTEVDVSTLFFNTPARRKFLKTVKTEFRHCVNYLTAQALAFPDIHFTVNHDSREMFNLPGSDLISRIHNLFGGETADALIELEERSGDYLLKGYVSNPQYHRSSGDHRYVYVNKRLIKDRTVFHAVRTAYRDLPADRHPFVVLFLEMPFAYVDVNVHPTKNEVRFRENRAVHDFIVNSLSRATGGADRVAKMAFSASGMKEAYKRRVREKAERYIHRTEGAADRGPENLFTRKSEPEQRYYRPDLRSDTVKTEPPEERSLPRIIGQYKNTYILAMDDRGLLIIDQHVAHERILYDKLSAESEKGKTEVQGLLAPVTMELAPDDFVKYSEYAEIINSLGFDTEIFGENTVALRAVPAVLSEARIEDAFTDLLDSLEMGGARERNCSEALISMACHGSVKKNTVLSREKMEYLVEKLYETETPTICPHGRPILLRYEHRDIEKGFKRR